MRTAFIVSFCICAALLFDSTHAVPTHGMTNTRLGVTSSSNVTAGGGTDVLSKTAEVASPSKEETLNAIKSIYEGQGTCSYQLVDSPYFNATNYYENFRFFVDGDRMYFLSEINNVTTNKDRRSRKVTSFNPADIDKFSYNRLYMGILDLVIGCRGEQECIYSGNQNSSGALIPFCSTTARDRIYRAIRYVAKLYTPSKQLPF